MLHTTKPFLLCFLLQIPLLLLLLLQLTLPLRICNCNNSWIMRHLL
jgi:hypothetical protein